MTDKTASESERLRKKKKLAQMLTNYLMLLLTLIFVFLYAAAYSGKLDPLKDNAMILHLEPVIFVLIGYYFGRLPSGESETALRDEIARQTQKADAAQYAAGKARQDCEVLEEKIKNAKTALKVIAPETDQIAGLRSKAIKAAVGILDS